MQKKYGKEIKYERNWKRIFLQILIILFSAFFGILAYIIYLDSQIYVYKKLVVGTKLSVTGGSYSDNSTEITDMIESTMESVVGISKLQDTGTSIFLENSIDELGLRYRHNCF